LIVKVERGGGRGVGSRCFIRWSFTHETLSTRQNAVNHPENRNTGNPSMYAREEALKPLEEELKRDKRSLPSKTFFQNVPLSEPAKTILANANKQERQLREERATRWALARIREATTNPEILTACAKQFRQALSSGSVFIGPELNRVVQRLVWEAQCLDEEDRDVVQHKHSCIRFFAREAVSDVQCDRERYAERQGREREREEAVASPIGGFSCRKYNATRAGYGPGEINGPIVEVALPEKINASGEFDRMLVQARREAVFDLEEKKRVAKAKLAAWCQENGYE
jgi:hypothetical protein